MRPGKCFVLLHSATSLGVHGAMLYWYRSDSGTHQRAAALTSGFCAGPVRGRVQARQQPGVLRAWGRVAVPRVGNPMYLPYPTHCIVLHVRTTACAPTYASTTLFWQFLALGPAHVSTGFQWAFPGFLLGPHPSMPASFPWFLPKTTPVYAIIGLPRLLQGPAPLQVGMHSSLCGIPLGRWSVAIANTSLLRSPSLHLFMPLKGFSGALIRVFPQGMFSFWVVKWCLWRASPCGKHGDVCKPPTQPSSPFSQKQRLCCSSWQQETSEAQSWVAWRQALEVK